MRMVIQPDAILTHLFFVILRLYIVITCNLDCSSERVQKERIKVQKPCHLVQNLCLRNYRKAKSPNLLDTTDDIVYGTNSFVIKQVLSELLLHATLCLCRLWVSTCSYSSPSASSLEVCILALKRVIENIRLA